MSPGNVALALPWLLALVALASARLSPSIALDANAIDGPIYAVLILCVSLAALFRRREAARFGLAAMVLPAAIGFGGTTLALFGALGGFAIAETARRNRYGRIFRTGRAIPIRDLVRSGGRIAAATALAGVAWRYLGSFQDLVAAALVGVVYLLATAFFDQLALRTGEMVMSRKRRLSYYSVEAAAWAWGVVLVAIVQDSGWTTALGILCLTVILTVEVARQAGLRSRAEYRLRQLKTVSEASRRMVSHDVRPGGIADRVLAQCRQVIDFDWLHFELLAGDDAPVSWFVEADGELRRGIPEPESHPKARPGFHRRQSWRILERFLEDDESPLGRLTLWCHPKKIDDRTDEIFEALCFQLTDSIQRSVLHQQANRDSLTGLGDRRVLEKRLEQLYSMCKAEALPMAVVMFDIDHFKQINDNYGHNAGDIALVEVAHLLASHGRERDLPCRFGGEEFTLLLEATHGRKALSIADRIRQVVESHVFEYEGVRIPLQMSAGVASFPELFVNAGQDLVLLADAALYEAKRRGRNRSLLNLGEKRFLTAAGRVLGSPRRVKPEPAPRLFT